MVWIVVGIILVILVLRAIGKQSNNSIAAAQPPEHTSLTQTPDQTAFAAERIGDKFHARTREQVESMFSGARAELPNVKRQAKAAERLSKAYEAAARKSRPDREPDVSPFKVALAKIRFMTDECERASDSLFFGDNDRAETRYRKLIDDLHEAGSDIKDALREIDTITHGILAGDYDEFWDKASTPAKKPRT